MKLTHKILHILVQPIFIHSTSSRKSLVGIEMLPGENYKLVPPPSLNLNGSHFTNISSAKYTVHLAQSLHISCHPGQHAKRKYDVSALVVVLGCTHAFVCSDDTSAQSKNL